MEYQKLLEDQAKQHGLRLTSLSELDKFPRSQKIPCCGGIVLRVETESSADSTIVLRDGSGATCFCAVHGDITSQYPDVLSSGALLFFTNITALVSSSTIPPVLIACLENLSGLMLPGEQPPVPEPQSSHEKKPTERASHEMDLHAAAAVHKGRLSKDSLSLLGGMPSGAFPSSTAANVFGDLRRDEPSDVRAGTEMGIAHSCPSAAACQAPLPHYAVPTNDDGMDDDEDCLELADNL